MGDSTNQEVHLNMNGNEQQKTGLEAEDIVADAIKLNVDEDLNEQRYDNSSEKSSNFQNGNQSLNIEDEPNYEIDENEEEELNEHDLEAQNEYDEQICEDDNVQNNENNSLNDDHDLNMDTTGNNDETTKKNESDEKDDNSTLDKNKSTGKEDKNLDKSKVTENKTESSQNDETSKKDSSKIDGNASESDSKATKSKSSSSKDKDRDRSADRKSNDKIVWVSGLSSSTKASDLQNLFKKYGKVVSAKIITNTKLPGSKIFGVITMESVEIAEKCIQKLNKTEFEGKTITVEKNRLEEKKDNKDESKKDEKSSKDKRDRSKSPRGRRSFSPIRRFPLPHHRPSFPPRRGHPPFGGFRGRGGFGPRPPFISGPPPGLIRKMEAERMFRKRELRAKERRRAEENYRRQKELERRQHEEREKLEREKLRIKIERERLEREKAEFLRAEREKARLERERIEREREEFRRKIQIPDSRNRGNLTPNKRFDDFVSTSSNWDFDRKPRFSSSSGASLTTRYDDLDNGLDSRNNLTNFSYNLLPTADLIDRRKLDASLAPISSSRDTYDMKLPSRLSDLNARSSSGSFDRGDDRRQSANGSRRNDRDEWKRTDIRFLSDKNSLTQSASQSSYLNSSSTRTSNYERTSDSWASAPDRMPPASSLNKFSSYAQVSGIADRARVQPNLTPNVVGSAIFQTSNIPMGGMLSNPNYSSNLSGSGHRRY